MQSSACHLLAALTLALSPGMLRAGSYNQNFNAAATGSTTLGDGSFISSNPFNINACSVQSQRLRLSSGSVGGTFSIYRLPDLDPGYEVSGFEVGFDWFLTAGTGMADGMSLNFGAVPLTDTAGPGEEGYQLPGGLVVSFDTYINAGEPGRSIDVRVDGVQLATLPESAWGGFNAGGAQRRVTVRWDSSGLDVIWRNVASGVDYTVCNNLAVPALRPNAGDRFVFSARTGGETETLDIDNLTITTTPSSPITTPDVALSELVIDNTGHEDEHCNTPGWVEIYNGTATTKDLSTYSLTDDPGTPAKWAFPAGATLGPYQYRVIYFGYDGDHPNPDTRLHATIAPAKTGGFLGLYNGATLVDAWHPYPAQVEDVAYGHLGEARTLGYLETPTPGLRNSGLQEAGPPVEEEVAWSRDGGLITGPVVLSAGAPVTPGASIRYTLDNSVPTPASAAYTAPFNVTASSNIRARIYAPGRLPGAVTSRTFLKLHSTVTNYRGTGQPFSSNLPVIVIDSFGRNLDAENSVTPGARPYRYTYNVVLAPDPASGNRTRLTDTAPVDFQGRSGMHVRGESSAGMPQRQYAWETWDNENNDKDVNILDLPQESDWILYAPATDKTLLRNFIAYSSMFDTNGEGSAMRTRFVEVFFNQPTTADGSSEITWQDYRGVYVLIERIKRGNDRVDLANLQPCDTTEPAISGGYIFKKDKASVDPDFTTTGGQVLQIVEPAVAVGDAQYNWLRNHVNAFEAALNGAGYADPVLGYRAFIEERTFMDNQWWVEIFKQIDGYRLSTYFSKDRGQKIKCAPLWDYNLSGGNAHYLQGYNYRGWYSSLVGAGDYQFYARLRTDAAYNQRHYDRYWQLRKTTFATSNIMARMDAAVNQLMDNQPLTSVTNGTGGWPNSTPSAELPAARHHARWQRLGIWDWPNAPGYANRSRYASTSDGTDYNTHTNTPYTVPASSDDATIGGQGAASPVMSEVVHFKAHLTNRLKWIDDSYIFGTTILRPPVFSHQGGLVTAPYHLTISSYTATPPPAGDYGLGGALSYAGGTVFYTTDGSDPAAGAASVVRPWVTDTSACHATVPPPPNADLANADSTGKDWRDPDFNHLSPPAGVTWYSGLNGVGYDDTRTTGTNFMPHLNIVWNTQTNPSAILPVNASNVMRNGTIGGITYPGNGTCYIRLPFTLTAADFAGINKLRLHAKYDDGFIAYLNGVKIAERNPPASAPGATSAAPAGRPTDDVAIIYEDVATINNAAAIATLRQGVNVLAIHGLNQGTTGNDCLQRFKLDGEISAVTAYTSPIVINGPVTVKARLLDNATGRWTPLAEATYTVNTVPASAANLVVSEIMYNPPGPTSAEQAAGFNNDNMFEYLEVQNISTESVDMAGVSFPNGFTFDWPAADVNLRILAPGERAVLVGHLAAFHFRYAPGPGIKIAGVFDGNLGNGGERLVMSGPLGVIKDFAYSDDPPWPVEADGDGYSLVLNNPAANPDHNFAVNWRASFEIRGTPGTAAGPPGPNAASALLDDDGDGMSNLMEHATGTLGNSGASQHWPATGMVELIVAPATAPDDYLTFSYTRGRAADGFALDPLVSTALTGWQPLSTLFTLMGQTNNPDGTATITWRSTGPASALPSRLYLKVQAALNP